MLLECSGQMFVALHRMQQALRQDHIQDSHQSRILWMKY